MAEFTFGSGGFFADPQACCQYLEGIVIAENYTFTQVGHSTMPVYVFAEFEPNGYTIKFTNNDYHYGELSRGNRIFMGNQRGVYVCIKNTGHIIVEKLNMTKTAWDTGGGQPMLSVTTAGFSIDTTNSSVLVEKCIARGCLGLPGGGNGAPLINVATFNWGSNVIIKGCKAWNAGGTYQCFNIRVYESSFGTIENCTAFFEPGGPFSAGYYGLSINTFNTSLGCFRNCVGSGSSVFDLVNTGDAGTVQAYNCADGDGSLVGFLGNRNISNITPADEFQSLDDSSPDFLKLKNGALVAGASALPVKGRAPLKVQFTNSSDYVFQSRNLGDGGTVPLYTTEDIGLNPIPTDEQFYSIGAHQVEVI